MRGFQRPLAREGVRVSAILLLAACGASSAPMRDGAPAAVFPGASGERAAAGPAVGTAAGEASTGAAVATPVGAGVRHSPADVRFMQHMIVHHGQALEMTALVPDRASRDVIRMLARRIALAQEDEIRQMQRWLSTRGEPLFDGHGQHGSDHDAHRSAVSRPADPAHGAPAAPAAPGRIAPDSGYATMPGMLTPAQLDELARARGAAFERLFLEYMIAHHEGALLMVAELFRSPGAAQESETFELATHIESDQRIEIARMRRMLHELQ
jgi:uncharacterized protein (DUF305 family)